MLVGQNTQQFSVIVPEQIDVFSLIIAYVSVLPFAMLCCDVRKGRFR